MVCCRNSKINLSSTRQTVLQIVDAVYHAFESIAREGERIFIHTNTLAVGGISLVSFAVPVTITIMTATNINICPGGELEVQAQSVLADLGLDVPTAINLFLTQVVNKKALPFEMDEAKPIRKKIPFSELYGCFKGKIWMADDFDAPLEEMREYME